MNQILVTKKLYVTPELKRKKKIYKIDFIVSVFLVIALISFYIYAEYDRNKDEGVAQDILTSMGVEDTTIASSDALKVVLNAMQEDKAEPTIKNKDTPSNNSSASNKQKSIHTAANGKEYTIVGTVNIPKISVKYPILISPEQTSESIEETLKVSISKFWGPEANEVGNFCIVGHNYRNDKFFSKVPKLENEDIIEITSLNGKTVKYKVYDKYTVVPTDVSCTTQLTNGKKEVTLITCTDDSELRVIVKCKEVK